MNDNEYSFAESKVPIRAGRKPYRKPQLREFGKLHTQTQGTGGNGEDGSLGMTKMSDRRAKQNIVCIGEHPLGIGLYLFDYKEAFRDTWGHGRQFGVMADEVEQVMPHAVTVHPDGCRVDYAMLGFVRSPN